MIRQRLWTLSLLAALVLSITARAQTSAQATVRAFELNVRQMPGRGGALLGRFPQGAVLNIVGREDQPGNGLWVYATPVGGGISGWVLSDYLAFAPGFNTDDLPVLTAAGERASDQPAAEGALTGTTTTVVNFRAGPGLTYPVILRLPARTAVALTGRSPDGAWLQASFEGHTGWMYARLVRSSADNSMLPIADANSSPAPLAGQESALFAGVVSGIGPRAREIYLQGQAMGNRRGVFSKVGDSITASPLFLTPIGDGGLHLHRYSALQPVVDFYMQTGARTHNSFANVSLAAAPGWTSADLLDPARNLSPDCQGDSPLVCEYRLNRPAVALIMIGTNDILRGVNPANYRANLERLVQISIDMGVIPVLSTIPDNRQVPGGVGGFNEIITSVAQTYGIPLWNYWLAMQGLPNAGLDPDGIHPSFGSTETGVFSDHDLQYGYNMRNLTALVVLDAVWRGALY